MNSIIKLTNGETIVAEIAHQDDNITSVLEPLALDVGESESGRPMLLAMTWIPLTKKVNLIHLKTEHVIAIAECDESISRYYERSLSVLKGEIEDDFQEQDFEDPEQTEIPTANTVH